MTPADWLLLLVALDAPACGLEPVRVQKALFLLAREGGLPRSERYWFVPYNYGPMSPRIYRDVDVLVRRGLLERLAVPGYAWGRVRATEAGRRRADRLVAQATARERRALATLAAIRRLVVSLGFADLLATIYDRHPEYAVRSVFRRGRGG
ncbi:MAG TPA: hypothetical protein VHF89_14475 [Solirubrobacteraceae bacterium]|nr:hypothetical protein [Solirubrobacteraceae bacterium]